MHPHCSWCPQQAEWRLGNWAWVAGQQDHQKGWLQAQQGGAQQAGGDNPIGIAREAAPALFAAMASSSSCLADIPAHVLRPLSPSLMSELDAIDSSLSWDAVDNQQMRDKDLTDWFDDATDSDDWLTADLPRGPRSELQGRGRGRETALCSVDEQQEEAPLKSAYERNEAGGGGAGGSRVCPEFCGSTGFPPSWRQDAQQHADTQQHARSPTPSMPQHLRVYSAVQPHSTGGGDGGGSSYSAVHASTSTCASASTFISALAPASLLVPACLETTRNIHVCMSVCMYYNIIMCVYTHTHTYYVLKQNLNRT